MAITPGQIAVTPGSGKILDTAELTVNAATVEREIVCIASPSTAANYAEVTAGLALKVDASATTQPVSGTFFQATQPVSIATAPVLVAGSAIIGKVGIDQTTPGTTNLVQVGASLPAGTNVIGHVIVDSGSTAVTQATAANLNATVTQQTLTKGTQGATGVSVQNLKDAGRTAIVLSASGIVSVTTVAMMTFQKWAAGAVTAGLTSYTVTAGKTFRIMSIRLGAKFATPSTTVTFASNTFNLLSGNATNSPLIAAVNIACQSNVVTPDISLNIPDGLELAAGTVLGISHLATALTLLEGFTIIGFEY